MAGNSALLGSSLEGIVLFLWEGGVLGEHGCVWPVFKLSDRGTGYCGEKKGGTTVGSSLSAFSMGDSARSALCASSAGDPDVLHMLSSRSRDSACLAERDEAVGFEVAGDNTFLASGNS